MKKAINIIYVLQTLCGIACILYGVGYIIGTIEVNPTTAAGLYAIACGAFGIVDAMRK
jgi:hypothetical protein